MFARFRNTAVAGVLVLSTGAALPAQAAYILTLQQFGPNVVAAGSGSIDLTDLSSAPSLTSASSGIDENLAEIITGPTSQTPVNGYTGFNGPTSFGTGGFFAADSGSGNLVGIVGGNFNAGGLTSFLAVPAGYVSGGVLSSSATWNDESFSRLGVAPGTYVWTWGSGAHADSFTLQTVPEPGTVTLMALGLTGLGMMLRLRRSLSRNPPFVGNGDRRVG